MVGEVVLEYHSVFSPWYMQRDLSQFNQLNQINVLSWNIEAYP